MKQLLTLTIATILFTTIQSFAGETEIRCKSLNDSSFETMLSSWVQPGEVVNSNIKQLTIFRGEATPQIVKVSVNVEETHLTANSEDNSVQFSTFLDEMGPNDISSWLLIDGETKNLNCDLIEE